MKSAVGNWESGPRQAPLDGRDRLPYPASAMNLLRSAFALVLLWSAAISPAPARAAERFDTVYLSEFLADNRQGLLDEDGERSGWIELHNGGTTPVNLGGWFLTDSATNLAKWRIPGVVLLPDKYLVVFASAKNRATNLVHLHANFRLDPQGSFLALVNPAKQIVSEFPRSRRSRMSRTGAYAASRRCAAILPSRRRANPMPAAVPASRRKCGSRDRAAPLPPLSR